MSKKILLVEDEVNIASMISERLGSLGYDLTVTDNASDATSLIQTVEFDLLILDIMLPEGNGFDIARRNIKKTPFIFLTARDNEIDELLGLGLGADDYIYKPFTLKVLVARIEAVFRRVNSANTRIDIEKDNFKVGPFKFDFAKRLVVFNKKSSKEEVYLTPNEFTLFSFLAKNEGKVISRDNLLEWIWGWKVSGNETRTVDAHIRSLRHKFGDNYIKTIHGVGYSFQLP
jgi:DNA-binding response OmpR family regulator